MNSVVYYSNTGGSEKVAKYLANKLSYSLLKFSDLTNYDFHNLVIVFPIYSQNMPKIVKEHINKINAKNVSIIACYGKMSYGNVIWEIINRTNLNVVSAAYVPIRHTYIKGDSEFNNYETLDFVIDKFHNPTKIKIEKSFKNPLANLLKDFRSKIGVKIIKNNNCDNCGKCKKACQYDKCIRCLKCVEECPNNALDFKLNIFVKWYLCKKTKNDLVVYK